MATPWELFNRLPWHDADLARSHAPGLADAVGQDGDADPNQVARIVDDLVTAKPYLLKPDGGPDVDQTKTGGPHGSGRKFYGPRFDDASLRKKYPSLRND